MMSDGGLRDNCHNVPSSQLSYKFCQFLKIVLKQVYQIKCFHVKWSEIWGMLKNDLKLLFEVQFLVEVCLTTRMKATHWCVIIAGPITTTLVDFWRLVWQEKPQTIVMVTNLKEGEKIKCKQYWPEASSDSFGPFSVTLLEQQVFVDYTIRTLQVKVTLELYNIMIFV